MSIHGTFEDSFENVFQRIENDLNSCEKCECDTVAPKIELYTLAGDLFPINKFMGSTEAGNAFIVIDV